MRALAVIALLVMVADCRCNDTAAPPVSKGFQPTQPGPPQVPSAAEQAKLERQRGQAKHFPERPKPTTGSFDLYVDGVLQRTVPIGDKVSLRALLPTGGVRSLLAHGESLEKWITPGQIDAVQIRLNRRGEGKLSVGSVDGGGGGGGGGGGDMRALQWIEVRTDKSALLPDEPQP